MIKPSPRLTALLAATAAAGFSGAAIAGAQDSTSTTPSTTKPAKPRGEALSSENAAKVKATALEKVPGATVDRTEAGGPYSTPYHAHVTTSDGTKQVVLVNASFQATAVQAERAGGPGRGGKGGPGGGRGMRADLAAIARDLDVTEAKLQSAVQASRPDKPANGARGDRHADEIAAISKSLGESSADVKAVFDSVHRSGERRGPRGDSSELVAALAKKFSVSTEKAQTVVDAAREAHQAEHDARHTAMYAAIAKELGKTASEVQKAFEANKPAKPAMP